MSSEMFNPVDSKVDFPAQEQATLAWWEENGIVDKYLKRNEASEKRFSFIDGPITANNPMGVHHGWGRTYKDLFQRFKTMQGYRQRYQNGFDGQGLWIEVEVEKELGFESKRDIEEFGIDRFVELCKQRVRKFADVQTWQSVQLGYWMDWDNSYHTMADENNYTIWHFLKVCHERGWIYEGTDVMPWCPRVRDGSVAARDRHRGLQGDCPSRSLPALPADRPGGRVAARLDDDPLDVDQQHRVLRSPGAHLREGADRGRRLLPAQEPAV